MQLDVAFAKPIGPYNNPINHIVRPYCHVEVSFHTTAETFRKQLAEVEADSTRSQSLELATKRISKIKGKIAVCFFINWGGVVSLRYLSDMIDDPYLRPPEAPVYDVVPIEMTLDQSEKLVKFYLNSLGKEYDYARAILSLCPITLRTVNENKFYCAQLVLRSLESMGMKFECDVNHVTPQDVHKLLTINTGEIVDTDGSSKSSSE